jgi:signal transduction histidine kinase
MKCLKRLARFTLAAALFLAVCSPSWAAPDRGSAEEAVAMVKKVIDDMKKNGKDKVIQDVQSQNPRYKDRDLYVFISSIKGITLANGSNPKTAGKDLSDIRDVDGKPMGKERFEMARTKGKGWQDYRWPDPLTKEIKKKSVYLERYDDLVISCGIYTD